MSAAKKLKDKGVTSRKTNLSGTPGFSRILVLLLLFIGFSLLLRWNLTGAVGEQQFVYLADSFLHGSLHFVDRPGPGWDDTSLYDGKYFWSLGPFPAVVLLPFVWLFGLSMQQGYLLFLLNLMCGYLVYRIALQITNNRDTSFWLSFGYVFSSAHLFIAMVPWSWYFAQASSTTLLLLSLYEYFGKRRFWLIGICLGLAVATRANLLFSILFFVYAGENKRDKLINLARVAVPVGVSLLLLLSYNSLRFHDFFEFGYHYQIVSSELAANRAHGLWSFVHFPANFYYFLLKGPGALYLPGSRILMFPYIYPDQWGMSILLTSPLFLWIFQARLQESDVKRCAVTSLVMLFVLFGYYGIGVRQYGYRYALDVYPFLLVILCYALRDGMTKFMKGVLIVSAVGNALLVPFVFYRWA